MKPKILVVDDEKNVRDLIQTVLEKGNYQVEVASSGYEAISVADTFGKIDILITDILMPRMNGKELANRICSHAPSVKVLFISAYSAEILTYHDLCPDKADLLRKPFKNSALLEKVGAMLDAGPTWWDLNAKIA